MKKSKRRKKACVCASFVLTKNPFPTLEGVESLKKELFNPTIYHLTSICFLSSTVCCDLLKNTQCFINTHMSILFDYKNKLSSVLRRIFSSLERRVCYDKTHSLLHKARNFIIPLQRNGLTTCRKLESQRDGLHQRIES